MLEDKFTHCFKGCLCNIQRNVHTIFEDILASCMFFLPYVTHFYIMFYDMFYTCLYKFWWYIYAILKTFLQNVGIHVHTMFEDKFEILKMVLAFQRNVFNQKTSEAFGPFKYF